MVFEKLRKGWKNKGDDEPEYIVIDTEQGKSESKIIVKTFVLKTYEDITPILNALREGLTIALIDIKTLKSKDVIELKRVISKIKKTIDALEGNIVGFGENLVIAAPSFAKVMKGEALEEKKKDEFETF